MKKFLILFFIIVTAGCSVEPKQLDSQTVAQAGVIETQANIKYELSDLEAITFACPKAALNAAAREAKKVPSLGSYQFSFFRIVSDSHHAQYEVHFKSNVIDEPDLKYSVSVYCQQGWDPAKSIITVQLMSDTLPSE